MKKANAHAAKQQQAQRTVEGHLNLWAVLLPRPDVTQLSIDTGYGDTVLVPLDDAYDERRAAMLNRMAPQGDFEDLLNLVKQVARTRNLVIHPVAPAMTIRKIEMAMPELYNSAADRQRVLDLFQKFSDLLNIVP